MSSTITRFAHLHRALDSALARTLFIYGPSFDLRGDRASPLHVLNRTKRDIAQGASEVLNGLGWIVVTIQFRGTGFLDRWFSPEARERRSSLPARSPY